MLGIPSGTVAAKASVIELLANTISGLGFITTKSINLLGKEGNKAPIFASHGPYSAINAVGLDNIGAEAFAADLAKIKLPEDFFLMVSLFGATVEDVVKTARILYSYADGFEYNASCSHSAGFGRAVGEDLDLLVSILVGLVALGKPVYLKLSARMDVAAIVERTKSLGIAGYTITNSFGPEDFKIDGHPVLTNKVGSISGKEITRQALECMQLVRQHTTLEIIGTGGISNGIDVRRAMYKGVANVCAIGTGLTGMSTAQIAEYIPLVLEEYYSAEYADKVNRFLARITRPVFERMKYQKFEVTSNTALADDLFELRFKQPLRDCGPGQFAFVWIPGLGERPFSVLIADRLSFLVGVKGTCTKFMQQLKRGDKAYVRGPCGNVPEVSGKILLVGGGTGVASLYLFAEAHGWDTVAVLGAKDRVHLYDRPFSFHCKTVYSYNETELYGVTSRGLVTDYLDNIFVREKPDFCLTCGPLGMVKKVFEIAEKHLAPEKILGSLEFHTDCGVGICGKDATSTGFRPCVDGTFMTRMQLGI